MSDALCFTSFDKFKSEVAQRTRKALQQQQQTSVLTRPPNQPENADLPTSTRPRMQISSEISNVSDSRQEESEESNKLLLTKSFRSDGSYREPIPLHERVPDRLKHIPKSLSMQSGGELRKPAPVSQRLLQMMPSKARFCVLYANDGQYNKAGVRVLLPETIDLLLDLAVQKLGLPAAARIIFRAEDGSVVSSVDEILDDENLVFSCKEPFKPQQDAETKSRPKASIPVKSNNGTFHSLFTQPRPC